jgi:hypothetical protein
MITLRTRAVLLASWLVLTARVLGQDADKFAGAEGPPSSPTGFQAEPVFHGFVFIDGRYLPPPYILEWKASALYINGVAAPLPPWDIRGDRFLAIIEQRLRDNAMMISVDGEAPRFFSCAQAAPILQVLVSYQTWPAKIEALVSLGMAEFHAGQWTKLVRRFRPTSEIDERVSELRERLATVTTAEVAGNAVVGMLLLPGMTLTLAGIGFVSLIAFRSRLLQYRHGKFSISRKERARQDLAVLRGPRR